MNKEELREEWNRVSEKVKEYQNIDSSQVNAFFAQLEPQAMSDDFIMLTASNDFIKTWIEKHYSNYIKQALEDLHGNPFVVAVEVDSSQESRVSEPVLEAPSAVLNDYISENRISLEPQKIEEVEVKEQISKGSEMVDYPISSLTFENFVIGDSNSMAYSMAVAVAEEPGKPMLNPLFIYGKSGLGKTHLLRAIQNYIRDSMPDMKVVYVDSAEFLTGFIDAQLAHDNEKSSYRNFKNTYQNADVLLIDDVQYLQGKKQTLEIVFQIFNKLIDKGKQVVLSADRAPKNIDIDERYRTRFNAGGTFDIQPPEVETKLGIIKSFVEEYRTTSGLPNFSIPEDIEQYIAENSSSNIRELKSAVTKVIYQMNSTHSDTIELADVEKLLENHFSGGPGKKLSVADIQKEVESFYKVSHADLVGKKRARNIVYARQVAIYLCRQMLDLPYNYIGKQFGGKDHTTIMYSVTNIEEKLKENRELREEMENIKRIIRDM